MSLCTVTDVQAWFLVDVPQDEANAGALHEQRVEKRLSISRRETAEGLGGDGLRPRVRVSWEGSHDGRGRTAERTQCEARRSHAAAVRDS
jgi:hypothetical protein